MLVMVMGIVFEMPLLAWVLSCLDLINKQFLRQYKSYAVVGLMVLSAVITPSGDPFSMMLVAVPLYLLYEMSILVVKK
jgi:sec-independent protein translocase protein TatC